jgi:hypothetical protein
MKNYVVDASIIIKWVLGDEKEPDHEKAMGLLNAWGEGDAYISAPKLWQYENQGRSLRENGYSFEPEYKRCRINGKNVPTVLFMDEGQCCHLL